MTDYAANKKRRAKVWVNALGCGWPAWSPGKQRDAWDRLRTKLAHGNWVAFEYAEAALTEAGVTTETARNILRFARVHGWIELQGVYCSSARRDSRLVRLVTDRADHECDRPAA